MDLYLRLSKRPSLLREEVIALPDAKKAQPVIIDEVQRVPQLLSEVHWLIENTDVSFILCGSSARKLIRGGAHLLGGRAWKHHFFPLVSNEIPSFDLLRAFNNGLLPAHYLDGDARKSLKAYISDYLAEEIKGEGLVRRLPDFSRFLDSLAFSHGEMTNYSNIARDCGIDSKTVKEYYQILIDTLMGYYVYPFHKKLKRALITSTPKFYLFDVGVANYLAKRSILSLQGSEAGKALEHYILMEIWAYRGLYDLDFSINYWRTKSGLEVDFILNNGDITVEVKISRNVKKQDLKGIIAFMEEHKPSQNYVVSLDTAPRKLLVDDQELLILPWQEFLRRLWNGDIIPKP